VTPSQRSDTSPDDSRNCGLSYEVSACHGSLHYLVFMWSWGTVQQSAPSSF